MLDKNKLIKKITKIKNFKIISYEPFDSVIIDFLNDFSNYLKKYKKISKYPDLIYLMFWCTKKRIELLLNNYKENEIRLGRGLIFHICPSNVPTNFVYSFFFGLISGNSNIVKLPSKSFIEKDIILSAFSFLFKKKKYQKIKNSNYFIKYNNENDLTEKISSISDGRVIWGGDKTINEIRKIWIPERCTEITFPDRYSLSLINIDKLKNENKSSIKIIAKKFYYDSYTMNQSACNSPHFVFWVGKKNIKIQNIFWNTLNQIVKKKFIFDDIHVVDKYSNLIDNIINQKKFRYIKRFDNSLYVLDVDKNTNDIENIRGVNGTFFQKNINQINDLNKFITKKCQTVTYFGFEKNSLKNFLLNNNLPGIDRIVPIGNAMEIDILWDGYDVIKSLSRVISLK